MELVKVTPRGYCRGVTRAIQLAKQTALANPEKKIYILGMLVHNMYVIEALKQLNIHTIDDKSKSRMELLDNIPVDSIVIFTAHGIAPEVIEKAKQKHLIYIDASCPDVIKTQDLVKEALAEQKEVLYVGKDHHPEAEAILQLSEHVHLLTDDKSIHQLPAYEHIFVTNQTTMSIFDIQYLFETIKTKYPHAQFCEEVCNATRIRQQAVANLSSKNIDLLYVVGDRHSNNSKRLAQIAREQGIANVYLIDDINGIQDSHFVDVKRVAVTSGASTPTYLTNQVISYLEQYEPGLPKVNIQIDQIL